MDEHTVQNGVRGDELSSRRDPDLRDLNHSCRSFPDVGRGRAALLDELLKVRQIVAGE